MHTLRVFLAGSTYVDINAKTLRLIKDKNTGTIDVLELMDETGDIIAVFQGRSISGFVYHSFLQNP